MGNPDQDLWNEFSEKEGIDNDFEDKLTPVKKDIEADGNEWVGRFDRRITERSDTPDTSGNQKTDTSD